MFQAKTLSEYEDQKQTMLWGRNPPHSGVTNDGSPEEERRTEMSGPGFSSQKLGLNQSLKTISGLSQDFVMGMKVDAMVDRSTGMSNAIAAATLDQIQSSSSDSVGGSGSGSGGGSDTDHLFVWESMGKYTSIMQFFLLVI